MHSKGIIIHDDQVEFFFFLDFQNVKSDERSLFFFYTWSRFL